MPLCGPRNVDTLHLGSWRPLSTAQAVRATCPAAITAAWPRHCNGKPPEGADRLLEWKPESCKLPAAVPFNGPAAVERAVGRGNVLRFIGDSLVSDHFKAFTACYLNCSGQAAPVLEPRCQREAYQTKSGKWVRGLPDVRHYANGTRLCEAPEGPQTRQVKIDLSGVARWDWRQALVDAGYTNRTADKIIHRLLSASQGELPMTGCSTNPHEPSYYHANGSLVRLAGAPARVDFRRINGFTSMNSKELWGLMHLLLYVGPVTLGFNDTVIMSVGLHYGSSARVLEEHMQTILEWWAIERAAGRAPLLLWRETSPQHFATADGMFRSYEDLVRTRQCRHDLEGVAVRSSYPDHNVTRRFHAPWFHAPWFHVLPTFAPTVARNDEHCLMKPGSNPLSQKALGALFIRNNESAHAKRPDCTHYCLPSSTMRFWSQVMLSWTQSVRESLGLAESEASGSADSVTAEGDGRSLET